MIPFILALFLLASYLIYHHVIYPYFLSPLSSIPNAHFTSPLSSRWIDHKRRTCKEVLAIYALHQKYGPIVRLGPEELSVNSIHGLKIIYTGAFEKHDFYNDAFVNFHVANMVGMVHNSPHAHQKRMLSKTFSKSFLQESSDLQTISKFLLRDRLMPILKKAGDDREVLNVLPMFQALGMDFISSFLFGSRQGTRYLFNITEWMVWLEEYEKFKFLSRDDRYMGFIEQWCMGLCERTEASKNENEEALSDEEKLLPSTNPVIYDQLQQSLIFQKEHDPRPLNLAVASELLDHLVAGHETTGITFTYMMWELSKQPELQTKLRKELMTISPSLRYSDLNKDGENVLPSPSAIDALPLLDAMVRETLRLHAPAPAQLPRVTPTIEKGTSIHGYDNIPSGVRVSSSAFSLHRIDEVYPQPEEWLPERWLHAGENIHDMRRLFFAFGSGGRMCLGSNFAMQEIKLVMAAVYSNFTTTTIDDEGIDQVYEFIALPRSRKLMLKFTPVDH